MTRIIWLTLMSVFLSSVCSISYFTVQFTTVNQFIALYCVALLCSLVLLAFTRKNRLYPLAGAVVSWLLLYPTTEYVVTSSLWRINGFAP